MRLIVLIASLLVSVPSAHAGVITLEPGDTSAYQFDAGNVSLFYGDFIFFAGHSVFAPSSSYLWEFFDGVNFSGLKVTRGYIGVQQLTNNPFLVDGKMSVRVSNVGSLGAFAIDPFILYDSQGGNNNTRLDPFSTTVTRARSVPTPPTLALLGLGIAGFGWSRRKKA